MRKVPNLSILRTMFADRDVTGEILQAMQEQARLVAMLANGLPVCFAAMLSARTP